MSITVDVNLYDQATEKRISWETRLNRLQAKVDKLQSDLERAQADLYQLLYVKPVPEPTYDSLHRHDA